MFSNKNPYHIWEFSTWLKKQFYGYSLDFCFLTEEAMFSWKKAPSIVTIFMQIDAQSKILWNLNFLKNHYGCSNFRKIWAIVLKMRTNIIHRSRTFDIEFYQNRLKRWNFSKFWIFSLNCVTCANFELLSSKFLYECINTKWCFIRNLVRIGRGL